MKYTEFTCVKCGESAQNTYSEPYFTDMLKNSFCFICMLWTYEDTKMERNHKRRTIIQGNVYSPGSQTSGSFRGMAGRRFDIEYIEPSEFAGKRITTFDLWSGGIMPDWLRAKWPDTAKFLEGAERVNLGKGGVIEACWNPSQSRAEPYSLPNTLNLA